MQVDQAKFIWLANQVHPLSVEQNSTSVVTVQLRSTIKLTHNYRANNRVEIEFNDGTKYNIPTSDDLQEIIRLHLMNKDAEKILKSHCEKYLEKVK